MLFQGVLLADDRFRKMLFRQKQIALICKEKYSVCFFSEIFLFFSLKIKFCAVYYQVINK